MSQLTDESLLELSKEYHQVLEELLNTIKNAKTRHISHNSLGIMINRQLIGIRDIYNRMVRSGGDETSIELFDIISDSAETLRSCLVTGQRQLLGNEIYNKILSQFNFTINYLLTRKDMEKRHYYYSIANFLSNILSSELDIGEVPENLPLKSMKDFQEINSWTNVLNSSIMVYFNVARFLPSIQENDYVKYLYKSSKYLKITAQLHPKENIRKEIEYNKQLERNSYDFISIIISWIGLSNLFYLHLFSVFGTKWPEKLRDTTMLNEISISGYIHFLQELIVKIEKYHSTLSELYKNGGINKNLGKPEDSKVLRISYMLIKNYKLALPRYQIYDQLYFDGLEQSTLIENIQQIEDGLVEECIKSVQLSLTNLIDLVGEGINILNTGLSSTYEFLFRELVNLVFILAINRKNAELYQIFVDDFYLIDDDKLVELFPSVFYLNFITKLSLKIHLINQTDIMDDYTILQQKLNFLEGDTKLYAAAIQLYLQLGSIINDKELLSTKLAHKTIEKMKINNFHHLVSGFEKALSKGNLQDYDLQVNFFDSFSFIIPPIQKISDYHYLPLNTENSKIIKSDSID